MSTPDFGIPLISQQQSNPEITLNEAIFALQLKSGIGVIGTQSAPPASPTEGDCYVVGASPSGAWVGHAHCIAGRYNGGWIFVPGFDESGTPITMGARHEGLSVWRMDTNAIYRWNGSAWA